MTDELKGCPFCGGEAEINQGGSANWWIQCKICSIMGERESTKERAIAAWNTRISKKEKSKE